MRVGPNFFHASSASTKLAIALVAGSLIHYLVGPYFGDVLPLIPDDVLHHLKLWQPLTYSFVAGDPMSVIFGALVIWQIGSSLESTWGSRRFVAFSLGITVLAGLVTCGVALLYPPLREGGFFGAWVMGTAIWVAYGLSFGRAETNFWGMPLSGNMFALIGVGFVVLNGAFAGWRVVVPDLFGLVFTLLYIKGASPRLLWLRFTSWRLQRKMKRRSKVLTLVSKDRNIGGDSDRYLH